MNNRRRPETYDFARYLASKVKLDDRSLSAHVRQALEHALKGFKPGHELRALELGAGIGTMIERLVAWDLLNNVHYRAVDIDPNNCVAGRERITHWGEMQGYKVVNTTEGGLELDLPSGTLTLMFEALDARVIMEQQKGAGAWNWIIAHAFMDLIDLETLIPGLVHLLSQGGLLYLTLNFDGMTHFEPTIDDAFDTQIETLYHKSMDTRTVDGRLSGHSRTGSRLLTLLPKYSIEVLAAGSSDWIVHPMRNTYPEDEAYFLHHIVHIIDQQLRGHPDLEIARFDSWIERRHIQIERGELSYIAHQIDVLGQAS